MGIFDIFGTGDQTNAANAQIAGINSGNAQATGNINQGIGALNQNYTAALQPYLQNYGNANAGVTQLGNVLGLNGAGGNASALQALRNTPGYQFQQESQDATVNAQAAASGMNASGNQLLALNKVNQGLADSTYNNYVSQLQPYLGASNAAAGGIAGVNTGLGNSLANQYGNLGNLHYSSATGIGNANANKDLAGLTASGNILNAIGAVGGAALGMPGMGGSFSSGGGGAPGSQVGGFLSGPTSYGGPGGPTPLTGGSLMGSIFSDERLKEDIEEVGALSDGQPVYKYRYIGSPVWQIGLMAQDVEKIVPEAVTEVGGYKAVNLNKATAYAADLARFLEAA
jgi:hypothetical protein